jgi:hypothetical protein
MLGILILLKSLEGAMSTKQQIRDRLISSIAKRLGKPKSEITDDLVLNLEGDGSGSSPGTFSFCMTDQRSGVTVGKVIEDEIEAATRAGLVEEFFKVEVLIDTIRPIRDREEAKYFSGIIDPWVAAERLRKLSETELELIRELMLIDMARRHLTNQKYFLPVRQ